MSTRSSRLKALNDALQAGLDQWAGLETALHALRDRQQRRERRKGGGHDLLAAPTPVVLTAPDDLIEAAAPLLTEAQVVGSPVPVPSMEMEPETQEEGWAPVSAGDEAEEAMARLLALADELPAQPASAPVGEEKEDRLQVDEDMLQTVMAETDDLVEQILEALAAWANGDERHLPALRRHVHTLKGAVGMVGGKKTQSILHDLETALEDIEKGKPEAMTRPEFVESFEDVQQRLVKLFDPSSQREETETLPNFGPVRVDARMVDYLITENSEARLASVALDGQMRNQRLNLRDLAENAQSLSRLLRDVEMYAESQLQSRRAQLAPGEEFDALELDQYTQLHEATRSLNELMADTFDLQRDFSRSLADQEAWLTQLSQAVSQVQINLHKTRLTPVDELHALLYRVVWVTGHDLGKHVGFILDSGRMELDRLLLERIRPPLEHLLRNAVDHGIEDVETRLRANKPLEGTIRVSVRQESGRISIQVSDDGGGIQVERVRQKAIEKGLWPSDKPMVAKDAADMICQPGFSTAANVTLHSGRGVGMDAVRSAVVSLGGRFEVTSEEGRGMVVTIHLPTTVATASVLLVSAGGERLAIPVDLVEDVARSLHAPLDDALAAGEWSQHGEKLPLARLSALYGLPPVAPSGMAGYVVLLRENNRRVAVAVDALHEVVETPLRPAGQLWAGSKGVAGITVLPDGAAAFLLDPLRASWAIQPEIAPQANRQRPVVLVVDDSITVRKAGVRFLEQHGFLAITAKDGQEALEILTRGDRPLAVLMDVEMPRMNGFQCLKAIRENERLADLPVIMITSRTAAKHRHRAEELGVLGYLGKPFNEDELDDLLRPLREAYLAPLPSA